MASTVQPPIEEDSSRQRIVDEAIRLVAAAGVRGATLRDVAAGCGASIASIGYMFGNKDGLIAECFARVVQRDAARLATLDAEADAMAVGPALAGPFLWTLCEEAAGARRDDMLVLTELWLSAASHPRFAAICRDWLVARRDAFRAFAVRFGAAPIAFDIIGLHLLSESSFAVSCHGSATYRMLARAGFVEAVARIAGLGDVAAAPQLAALAARFFADPETGRAPEPAKIKGRGAESRARIVDAAASIIEGEGLAAVTNRAVAERAGVSLALTTYHFKSVTELAFAGVLRVFEKVNAGFARTTAAPPTAAATVERMRSRSQPSGVERLRSRGMAEISLAAARGIALESLGLAMRRQRGTITYASLGRGARGGDVSRTRAASHALWASAAFLTAAAVDDADTLFDFESQARIAAAALLGIS